MFPPPVDMVCGQGFNVAVSSRPEHSNGLGAAKWAELDRQYVWHPFTPMADWLANEPLVIVAGEGVWLVDADGRRYLDGVSSLWCNLHGHRHPVIDAAVREQLDRLAHSTMLGLTHPTAVELAEQLVGRSPVGPGRVFYSDAGATAVEIAAKIAFTYWQLKGQAGRTKFLTFGLGYHGDTVGTVSLGGIDLFHASYRALLFPTVQAPPAYCYRCALIADCELRNAESRYVGLESHSAIRNPQSAFTPPCLRRVDELLSEHSGKIAAVVAEPLIQGAAGVISSPPGYLHRLAELARSHGVLLIADEVAVGFWRTGKMFACRHESVAPDILCLAKGISGGYLPLAATIVSERVFEPFNKPGVTFYHGHTYTGNPLGCAAGLASLKVFDDERVVENLPPKIERFSDRLDKLRSHPHVGDVRGRGLFAGVELVADRAKRQAYDPQRRIGARVCSAARKHGLIIRPLGDVLVFIPPLCVTVGQIDAMFDAAEAAMAEVIGTADGRG